MAGMATVYFGTSIPYLQQHGWRQMEIRAEEVARRTPFRNTDVIGGIQERECNALLGAALRDAFKV
jgi:tRNA(adenine34) deaminase